MKDIFNYFISQALLTLFVFSTKDGWVTIMYDGIDAVGVDKQVNNCSVIKYNMNHTMTLSPNQVTCENLQISVGKLRGLRFFDHL